MNLFYSYNVIFFFLTKFELVVVIKQKCGQTLVALGLGQK